MEYKIETWPIEKIIKLHEDDKLNLSPEYQRNEIWPIKAKQKLIDSIRRNKPIPNFFLYKENGKYEIVDGQQRTRALLGYYKGLFKDSNKSYYDEEKFPEFLEYLLSVTIITKIEKHDSIEQFYALVNSTGLKLNRPELKKAEYYKTKFLVLLENLSTSEKFNSLELFRESSINRMQDIDFIGELVSLIKNGITDKKKAVNQMFEADINKDEYDQLYNNFESVLDIINSLNNLYEIKETRYRQRNDFYTLFGFVNDNIKLGQNILDYFYKILVLIGEDIAPSNEECEPFKEYAFHCVSQSNSKNARLERLKFFNELFLNTEKKANETQKKILNSYKMKESDLQKIGDFLTLSVLALQEEIGERIFD
ncbi:MAG: DUF262 domain-containing protein [Candidatus Aminicenantes bacterium]|nr:DUF262 domain-containing protein [Candidatus Aminicenantes bacterium]